jgi:hypothetical protein
MTRFIDGGDLTTLDYLEEHGDALTNEHKLQIGQKIYTLLGPSMELVHVEFSYGSPVMRRPPGLFKKAYPVPGGTVVVEKSRTPIAWMPGPRLAITPDGDIFPGKDNHSLTEAHVVIRPGVQVTASRVDPPYDGAWGQPDRPTPSHHVVGLGTVVQGPNPRYQPPGADIGMPVLKKIKAELERGRR